MGCNEPSGPAHQIHNTINDYEWQFKGKKGTKEILSNTGRRRLNIIGALEPTNLKPITLITESNCDQEVIKSFLYEIKKSYSQSRKIHMNILYNFLHKNLQILFLHLNIL